MRIGEIAERTGLSISNIRFYEKKGLIGPNRDENSKYRNYSKEDLAQLRRIILYRKMDLPVETIGGILDGRVSLEEVLSQQLLELKDKRFMIQGSIDLCQQIVSDHAYDHMNLDYYMDYVKKEEENGRKFGNIDSFLEEFSEFTQAEKYTRNSILGWYLCSHPRMNKIFTMLWCVLFVLYPVFGIVDDLIDENGLSPGMLFFWMMWIVFCGVSFIGFQRAKKKEGLS